MWVCVCVCSHVDLVVVCSTDKLFCLANSLCQCLCLAVPLSLLAGGKAGKRQPDTAGTGGEARKEERVERGGGSERERSEGKEKGVVDQREEPEGKGVEGVTTEESERVATPASVSGMPVEGSHEQPDKSHAQSEKSHDQSQDQSEDHPDQSHDIPKELHDHIKGSHDHSKESHDHSDSADHIIENTEQESEQPNVSGDFSDTHDEL